MATYVDDILAPSAALNELAALGLAEAAAFFESAGQATVADLLWDQVRRHRVQAVQLWALNSAKHVRSSHIQPPDRGS